MHSTPLHKTSELLVDWNWVQNFGAETCLSSAILTSVSYLNSLVPNNKKMLITQDDINKLVEAEEAGLRSSGQSIKSIYRKFENYNSFFRIEYCSPASIQDISILMTIKPKESLRPIIVFWDDLYARRMEEGTSHANVVYSLELNRQVIRLIEPRLKGRIPEPIHEETFATFERGWKFRKNKTWLFLFYNDPDPPTESERYLGSKKSRKQVPLEEFF